MPEPTYHRRRRRVLITGGAGLLGSTLIESAPSDVEVHATRRSAAVSGAIAHAVELSDRPAVAALLESLRPDLVIHTAYSVAQGERDIWKATCSVVDASMAVGAALICLSTDAHLDGEHSPYDEHVEPAPVHEYGQWKARAEKYVRRAAPAAAVVRTSLIVRADPPDPNSAWVIARARGGEPLTLFVDEIRCPIAVDDLAAQIWELADLPAGERAGVWNLAGPEAISRFALGALLLLRAGVEGSCIVPGRSAASPTPRPRDLRLSTARADRVLKTRARTVSDVLFPASPTP